MFRTLLWSLMRLRFAGRTSPSTLNNLSTEAHDGILVNNITLLNTNQLFVNRKIHK